MKRFFLISASLFLLLGFIISCFGGKKSPPENIPSPVEQGKFASFAINIPEAVIEGAALVETKGLEFLGVMSDKGQVVPVAGEIEEGKIKTGFIALESVQGEVVELVFKVIEEDAQVQTTSLKGTLPSKESKVFEPIVGSLEGLTQNPLEGYDLATLARSFLAVQGRELSPQAADSSLVVLEPNFVNYPLGDMNRNKKIDFEDAIEALITHFELKETPTDYQLYNADMDCSGSVDFDDVVNILLKLYGLVGEIRLQVCPRSVDLWPSAQTTVLVGNSGDKVWSDLSIETTFLGEIKEALPDEAIGKAYTVIASKSNYEGPATFKVINDDSAKSISIKVVANGANTIQCNDLSLDVNHALPVNQIAINGLPDDIGSIFARVTAIESGSYTYTLIASSKDDADKSEHELIVPLYPVDGAIKQGGEVSIAITDGRQMCQGIPFTIDALPTANGTSTQTIQKMKQLVEAIASQFGMTSQDLLIGDVNDLPPHLIPLALLSVSIDHPDNPNSFVNILNGTAPILDNETIDPDLLDSILAASSINEALDKAISDFNLPQPISTTGVNSTSLFTLNFEFDCVGIKTAEELSFCTKVQSIVGVESLDNLMDAFTYLTATLTLLSFPFPVLIPIAFWAGTTVALLDTAKDALRDLLPSKVTDLNFELTNNKLLLNGEPGYWYDVKVSVETGQWTWIASIISIIPISKKDEFDDLDKIFGWNNELMATFRNLNGKLRSFLKDISLVACNQDPNCDLSALGSVGPFEYTKLTLTFQTLNIMKLRSPLLMGKMLFLLCQVREEWMVLLLVSLLLQ